MEVWEHTEAQMSSPGTKHTRSKNVFAVTPIALTLVPLSIKLFEIPAHFLTGSPRTLHSTLHIFSGQQFTNTISNKIEYEFSRTS